MEFQPGRTSRGPQFSKEDNDTDLYISAAGEDALDNDDAHNPFKQDFSQPIPDPDDAALAALAHRYTPPATGEKRQHASSPGPASTPPDLTHSESSSHEEHELRDGDAHGDGDTEKSRPAKRQRRKYSESSRDLVVQPGDDVEEEDRKMRTNLQRIGSTVEEDEDEKDGGRSGGVHAVSNGTNGQEPCPSTGDRTKPEESDQTTTAIPADETTRPSESDATGVVGVEPVPLMDKITTHDTSSEGQKEEATRGIPVDDEDRAEKPEDAEEEEDDGDIEPKEGDDYDVENYAVFEDDQDDVGQELEEDGPEMDERLMINEEELAPSGGVKDEDQPDQARSEGL